MNKRSKTLIKLNCILLLLFYQKITHYFKNWVFQHLYSFQRFPQIPKNKYELLSRSEKINRILAESYGMYSRNTKKTKSKNAYSISQKEPFLFHTFN